MIAAAYIFIGGGLGSLARFGVGKLASKILPDGFPWGTLIANMLACSILALIVLMIQQKPSQASWLSPLLIIGFCGGFSTFSSFSNESLDLIQQGSFGLAVANILVSVAFGIGTIYFIRMKM